MDQLKNKEKWKPIKGEWGAFYAVSNFGRVKSLERTIQGWKRPVTKKERLIKLAVHKRSGLLCFRAWSEGKAKVFFVHRIVAQTFVRKARLYNVVSFRDGDVKNCSASNLYWTAAGEAIKAGLRAKREAVKNADSG